MNIRKLTLPEIIQMVTQYCMADDSIDDMELDLDDELSKAELDLQYLTIGWKFIHKNYTGELTTAEIDIYTNLSYNLIKKRIPAISTEYFTLLIVDRFSNVFIAETDEQLIKYFYCRLYMFPLMINDVDNIKVHIDLNKFKNFQKIFMKQHCNIEDVVKLLFKDIIHDI